MLTEPDGPVVVESTPGQGLQWHRAPTTSDLLGAGIEPMQPLNWVATGERRTMDKTTEECTHSVLS